MLQSVRVAVPWIKTPSPRCVYHESEFMDSSGVMERYTGVRFAEKAHVLGEHVVLQDTQHTVSGAQVK